MQIKRMQMRIHKKKFPNTPDEKNTKYFRFMNQTIKRDIIIWDAQMLFQKLYLFFGHCEFDYLEISGRRHLFGVYTEYHMKSSLQIAIDWFS